MKYPIEQPALTTAQVSARLEAAISTLMQIHNEHALERATCARLMEEKDAEVARLTSLCLDLLNLANLTVPEL